MNQEIEKKVLCERLTANLQSPRTATNSTTCKLIIPAFFCQSQNDNQNNYVNSKLLCTNLNYENN